MILLKKKGSIFLQDKFVCNKTLGAFERKSPQSFSNDYSVFPDCILG